MTTEEKAKAYDDALSVAKEIHSYSSDIAEIKRMEQIFPELAGLEDENIRKKLIKVCEDAINYKTLADYTTSFYKDAIAWLEKQCEQKPIDKVEPKFHEGDWVVCEVTDSVYQIKNCIENLSNHKYGYDLIDGGYIGSDEVTHYHLWTIADAKDGDVLAEDSCIFIIQKLGDNSTAAKTYCTLYNDGDFDDGSILYFDIDSTKPATKKQCDTLERAMTNAGYRWNKEELKLEKI